VFTTLEDWQIGRRFNPTSSTGFVDNIRDMGAHRLFFSGLSKSHDYGASLGPNGLGRAASVFGPSWVVTVWHQQLADR
jgi:hypothetical protein